MKKVHISLYAILLLSTVITGSELAEKDSKNKLKSESLTAIEFSFYSDNAKESDLGTIEEEIKGDSEQIKKKILAIVDAKKLVSDASLRIGESTDKYYLTHFSNKILEKKVQTLLAHSLEKNDISIDQTYDIPILHKLDQNRQLIPGSGLLTCHSDPYHRPVTILIGDNDASIQQINLLYSIGLIIANATKPYEDQEYKEVSASIYSLGLILENIDIDKLCDLPTIINAQNSYLNADELHTIGKKILDLKKDNEEIDINHYTKTIIAQRKK